MEKVLYDIIKKHIDKGKRDFVIAPMGNLGKRVKALLGECEIQPLFCLDNYQFDMKHIFPIEYLSGVEGQFTVILTVQDMKIEEELYEQIRQYVPQNRIIRTFDDVYKHYKKERLCQIDNILLNSRVKLDFLCVGFEKCGSTSLDAFLRKNTNIGMPIVKSTRFLSNPSEACHEVYLRRYTRQALEKDICGGVEVSYFRRAEEVFHYYGENLKIIFLLRNPVNVLYSEFKHNMREGMEYALKYIDRNKGVSLDVFENYIQEYRDRCKLIDLYKYVEWIKQYLQWYPKNQMMFIICEEMYKRPNEEMKKLQDFIGLQEDEIIECDQFPYVNKGDSVAKNYVCAGVNNAIMSFYSREYCFLETIEIEYLMQIRDMIFEQTTVEFQDKLSKDFYDKLLNYYMDSIKELEEVIGRSFEGIWY